MTRASPILFSGPMVRALLDGRKTQTRRLAWKREPDSSTPSPSGKVLYSPGKETKWLKMHRRFEEAKFRSDVQHYRELLYVRETWAAPYQDEGNSEVFYRADGEKDLSWRPSIHMPRWASRLTLEVHGTKLERLLDITPQDCMAEGIEGRGLRKDVVPRDGWRRTFADLWNTLHPDNPWKSNPEVVVLTFRVHRCNVDEVTL